MAQHAAVQRHREEEALRASVEAIVKQHRVEGLLTVDWEREARHLTALPPLLKRILKLLHLSPTLYTRLTRVAA